MHAPRDCKKLPAPKTQRRSKLTKHRWCDWNISAATQNSTTFRRSYSVSDAYRIQLCLGSPRFGRQNLACPYSSLASVNMKSSTKSSITFYRLDFTPQELLHRDHSGVLRLDRWSGTTLRCSPSFRFLRSADLPCFVRLLWLCFGLVSLRAAFCACVHGHKK